MGLYSEELSFRRHNTTNKWMCYVQGLAYFQGCIKYCKTLLSSPIYDSSEFTKHDHNICGNCRQSHPIPPLTMCLDHYKHFSLYVHNLFNSLKLPKQK